MKNGIYTVYAIEFRIVGKSPWLEPEKAIIPYEEGKWGLCGEHFAQSLVPWSGKGNDFKPKFPLEYEQWNRANRETDIRGWFDVGIARKAIKRVRRDSEMGAYDYRDGYGILHQCIKYEFRIVKIDRVFFTETTVL